MSTPLLSRPLVLWNGPPLSAEEQLEFERRGLKMDASGGDLEGRLPTARAFIVHHKGNSPNAALEAVHRWGKRTLDHGLAVFIWTADEASTRAIIGGYQKLIWKSNPRARLRESPPAYEIAEAIARSDPGPPFRALDIFGLNSTEIALPSTVRLLLSRAFHDCRSIVVDPMTEGRAGRVYRIFASLERSIVGPLPLPFFAKMAKRNAINDERDHYREFVAGFVPSHLHPRVDEQRCVDAATQSLLVGSFVDASEPLVNAVTRGMGDGPIQSLCTETLRGWHTQAFATPTRETTLLESLRFGNLKLQEGTVARAAALGLSADASKLQERLRSLHMRQHVVGPIHGDLHARNVQVRDGQAILIDFRSTRQGPIAADLASLEVSVAFDSYGKGTTQASWTRAIDDLYDVANIDNPPKPLLSHSCEAWLWSAVRLIRQQASFLRSSASEYRELLAIYLLRRAGFRIEHEREGDGYRRAYALIVGERLLASLESSPQ